MRRNCKHSKFRWMRDAEYKEPVWVFRCPTCGENIRCQRCGRPESSVTIKCDHKGG